MPCVVWCCDVTSRLTLARNALDSLAYYAQRQSLKDSAKGNHHEFVKSFASPLPKLSKLLPTNLLGKRFCLDSQDTVAF